MALKSSAPLRPEPEVHLLLIPIVGGGRGLSKGIRYCSMVQLTSDRNRVKCHVSSQNGCKPHCGKLLL